MYIIKYFYSIEECRRSFFDAMKLLYSVLLLSEGTTYQERPWHNVVPTVSFSAHLYLSRFFSEKRVCFCGTWL
ncbi:hypothetical protein LEP1GSC047_1705 [Leptospira inadai serovar Lyme str. 10]|uniref:Uncharacterized protein n=1 Tax=Leptospira inadai serovar Lyme str. 10 TaxID=1049790 RepID=V6H8U9_9LEPT|nr:hypothetical protein LEP1GSC047_1705 [Leptospira inadai serovar Lyme str. 10]